MVEKAFFGPNHLPKINKMASIVLLNLDRRTSISTFQSRFLEENKKAKTPNNPELSLQRSKRGNAFEVEMAYCALGKPAPYFY